MTDKIIAGKYKVIRELGRGGMGVIYETLHIGLNRTVALKILHPHLTSDTAFLKRFQREARAMARLNHENIIKVFDVAETQGSHYIEMEYFAGKDLKQVMVEERPLSKKRALDIAYHVANALSYAHSHGIIHRDIKPANIMVDQMGLVKIADFGIAAATDEVSVTATGNVIGTPEYMSPEQARGEEELDGRSDLYSLGMVIHEMIAGRTTFGGVSGMAILGKLVYEPEEFSLFFPEGTLVSVKELTATLLKKNRTERIPDAATLADQISTILRELKEQPDHSETTLTETVLQTALQEPPVVDENEIPETVIFSKFASTEKTSQVNPSPPTVVFQKETQATPVAHSNPTRHSKKSTPIKKDNKWIVLISAVSIVSILFAGFFYYFSSLDDEEPPTQQESAPVRRPSTTNKIKALQRSITEIEQKLAGSREAAETLEVRRLAKKIFGQGIDVEGRGAKRLDDARLFLKKDDEQKAQEAFQSALSLLSKADGHFQKAKQTAEMKILQEEKSRAKKESEKQKIDKIQLEKLKQERARAKKERLKLEKLTRLEQEKLKQEKARAERERLNQEKTRVERKRLEQERARAEQERLEQEGLARVEQEKLKEEKAKIEKERLVRERVAAERKKLNLEKVKAEQERLRMEARIQAEKEQLFREKLAKRKKPAPITPGEINVLGGLLNGLKTAYEKKDLKALQNMSRMSKQRHRFLEQIFSNYQNIKISIIDLSIIGNEARAVISITKLSSLGGNLVVPSSRWKDAEVILHRKVGKWGKIVW